MKNLFADLPAEMPVELVETLINSNHVRVERIVSSQHASPPGFWYNQDEHEWVTVLAGAAGLLFEGDDRPVRLLPGDHVMIPAHRKHRVEWTSPEVTTVWLAVFYRS